MKRKHVFLSKSWLVHQSQAEGLNDLFDNLTTDHITRIKDVLLLESEALRRSFMRGLAEWGNRTLEVGKDSLLVAGESFGIGSSRETSAEAVKLNGFSIVLAKSFGPIFKENLINQGIIPVSNFALLERLTSGETIDFELLTADLSYVHKQILLAGGLPGYIRAIREGKADLPQDLIEDRAPFAQTSIEKLATKFSHLAHQELKDRSDTVRLKQGDSAILKAQYFVAYDVFFAHTLRVLSEHFEGNISVDLKDLFIFVDHFGLSKDPLAKEAVRQATEFWKAHPEVHFGADGVYNKIMPRTLGADGLVIGMDSHTPELGIVPGMLAMPIGYTPFACSLAQQGLVPITVPGSIKLTFEGTLPGYCEIKDALWTVTNEYFSGSLGNGHAFEIGGSGYSNLAFDEAAKIFNTVTEFGGIGAIGVDYNPQVVEHLRVTNSSFKDMDTVDIAKIYENMQPDDGAQYVANIQFDLGKSRPAIVGPHSHKKVRYLDEMATSIPFDRIIYNSCAGSSTLDLAVLAAILSNEKRTIPVDIHLADPLTRIQAEKLGLLYELVQSGVNIDEKHSCGPCMGQGAAVRQGERVLSTNNRNYPGRMGHDEAEVYLTSSVVAALTAKLGRTPNMQEIFSAESAVYRSREKVQMLIYK